MSATPSTLPPDWGEFLGEVHRHVRQAIVDADARLAQTPALDLKQLAQERNQETARLEECLHGLGTQLESADHLVRDVDVALLSGEQLLRQHVDSCASVRQRLADWAGRAIG